MNPYIKAILDLKLDLDKQAVPLDGRKIRISADCAREIAYDSLGYSFGDYGQTRLAIFSKPELAVGSRIFGFDVVEVSGDETVVFLGDEMKVTQTEYGYWNDRVNKHKKLIFGAILGCLFRHKTQYIDLDNMRFKIVPWPPGEEMECRSTATSTER